MSKPVVLKDAVVTKYSWLNPHVLIYFDLKERRLYRQDGIDSSGRSAIDFAQRLASPPVNLGNHDEQLRELSRQLVAGALKRCHDNKSKAADL